MARKEFAKLFEFDEIGQVLVVQDQTDCEIKITIYPKGFGLVSVGLEFESFDLCDKEFDSIDSTKAYKLGKSLSEQVEGFRNEQN